MKRDGSGRRRRFGARLCAFVDGQEFGLVALDPKAQAEHLAQVGGCQAREKGVHGGIFVGRGSGVEGNPVVSGQRSGCERNGRD